MADPYRTLPDDAAATWESDTRKRGPGAETLKKDLRDPWAS
ncbi:MAG: hypothetical protein ACYDC3_08010 [Candidatus Binataceae bacterium]